MGRRKFNHETSLEPNPKVPMMIFKAFVHSDNVPTVDTLTQRFSLNRDPDSTPKNWSPALVVLRDKKKISSKKNQKYLLICLFIICTAQLLFMYRYQIFRIYTIEKTSRDPSEIDSGPTNGSRPTVWETLNWTTKCSIRA